MEKTTLFEYQCPECEGGMVRTTTVLNFRTKVKGYPFVVPEAHIGVCESCKSKQYAPEETRRWEDLFCKSLEQREAFLSPSQIRALRMSLELSLIDFARLIGCTRQSVAAWESPNRPSPPSRMADMLMKLLRLSLQTRNVDVLSFLAEETKKWGAAVEVRRSVAPRSSMPNVVVLRTKRISTGLTPPAPAQSRTSSALPLAAEERQFRQETFLAETLEGTAVGELGFDYERAALFLVVTGHLPDWKAFDIALVTNDDHRFATAGVSLNRGRLTLLENAPLRPADLAMIELTPAGRDSGDPS